MEKKLAEPAWLFPYTSHLFKLVTNLQAFNKRTSTSQRAVLWHTVRILRNFPTLQKKKKKKKKIAAVFAESLVVPGI